MSRERKQRRDERRFGVGGHLFYRLIGRIADAERRTIRTPDDFDQYVRELTERGVVTRTQPTPELSDVKISIDLDHPSLASGSAKLVAIENLFREEDR